MNDNGKYNLLRLWIAGLMIISWCLCLGTVAFPYDHVLGYYPTIMYIGYSLMLALALGALIVTIIKKPLLANLFPLLIQTIYFVMFGILFILRLRVGYILSFPLIMISLFVMASFSIIGGLFTLLGKKQQGYLFSIITYSCFTMAVIIESYPVAYDAVSETYGYIKLVYFFAIIAVGILGIIYSAKMLKQVKKESHQ